MKEILSILNTPWISGIGVTIIGGLLLFLIIQLIPIKNSKQYSAMIKQTNDEVLKLLIDMIAEEQFPKFELVESYRNSFSLKNSVDKSDLFTAIQFKDILIKEISQTSFIGFEKKKSLISYLNENFQIDSSKLSDPDLNEKRYERKLWFEVTRRHASNLVIFTLMTLVNIGTLVFLYNYLGIDINEPSKETMVLNIILLIEMIFTIIFTVRKIKKIIPDFSFKEVAKGFRLMFK